MERQIVLTKEGQAKIKEELEILREKARLVVERIKKAKDYGDLNENSEYDDAKNEQSMIEGRIQELESLLRSATVITKQNNSGEISIGSLVTIQIEKTKEQYQIVGVNEGDPASGKISSQSPLGQTLLGHKKGETVEVTTPSGVIKYKVVDIK